MIRVFMSEAPFFQDYFTYLKAKKAAKKLGIKYKVYIVQCVADYLGVEGTSINKPERFHDTVYDKATSEGITVAMLIEKAVATKVGEVYKPMMLTPISDTSRIATEKPKLKPWELPKG